MREVYAKKDDGQDDETIKEVHKVDKGTVDDAAYTRWVGDCKDFVEVILADGLHGQMEGEKHKCRSKVDQEVTEVKVKDLKFEEEVCNCHLWTCGLTHLFLNLLKSKHGAVDPPLSLTHQTIDCLDRIHLSISIRHEQNIELVLMNTHT